MQGQLCLWLGVSFCATALVSLRPLLQVRLSIGTTFYAIIFVTSALRALWFALPLTVEPSRVPRPVVAFDGASNRWLGTFVSELLDGLGSVCL